MELAQYVAIAKRWWLTLLVAVWVAGVAGYLVVDRLPETYEARARVLVGPVSADIETIRGAVEQVPLYAELITSQPLLEATIDALNLPLDRNELRLLVSSTADTTTRLLDIRVQHDDPVTAAAIANTLAEQLAEYASSELSRPDGRPVLLDRAEAPETPVAPQVGLITGMAAIVGLLGALILVILVEYFSDTVRDEHDLAQLTGAPVLGVVNAWRGRGARSLVVSALPESSAASRYRLLTTKIAFADPDQQLRSVLVMGAQTAGNAGEIAANLAAVLQRSGRRVVLVDANEDEAEITERLWLPASAADGLAGQDLEKRLVQLPEGISVLPVGVIGGNEMLNSQRAGQVLKILLERADIVVVNAAPAHLSANTLVWARLVDATVLTAYRDQTRRENVRYAIESLRLVGVNIIGSVMMLRGGSWLSRADRRSNTTPSARTRSSQGHDLSRTAED